MGMTQRCAPTRRPKGVVSVELALLLIPLVLLLMGSADAARSMYYYGGLVKQVRDATRMLSERNPLDPDYLTVDVPAAQCLAVFGNTQCTGDAVVGGLETGMVKVCDRVSSPSATPSADCAGGNYQEVATGSGVINLVQVRIVGYPYTGLTSVVAALAGIDFNDIQATMRQIL